MSDGITQTADSVDFCAIDSQSCGACGQLVQLLNIVLPEHIQFPYPRDGILLDNVRADKAPSRSLMKANVNTPQEPLSIPPTGVHSIDQSKTEVSVERHESSPMGIMPSPVVRVNNVVLDKDVNTLTAQNVKDYLQQLHPEVFADKVTLTGDSEVVHHIFTADEGIQETVHLSSYLCVSRQGKGKAG